MIIFKICCLLFDKIIYSQILCHYICEKGVKQFSTTSNIGANAIKNVLWRKNHLGKTTSCFEVPLKTKWQARRYVCIFVVRSILHGIKEGECDTENWVSSRDLKNRTKPSEYLKSMMNRFLKWTQRILMLHVILERLL